MYIVYLNEKNPDNLPRPYKTKIGSEPDLAYFLLHLDYDKYDVEDIEKVENEENYVNYNVFCKFTEGLEKG